MLRIDIPGGPSLNLAHLVLDYNGTLAVDGSLAEGVAARLQALAAHLQIHVITADTFGSVQREVAALPCQMVVIGREDQAGEKLKYIQGLGIEQTVCVGNGVNDRLMLQAAALGIAVIQAEGAAGVTLQAADVVTTSIADALDLLLRPLRLTATLRS
jgi:soluble P-type ATPase